MKQLLFFLATIVWLPLFAQQKTPPVIKSTLTNATVYYGYGAELNHTAKLTLTEGLQEIAISNIATQVDASTIQVGCPENVILMSYRFGTISSEKPVQLPIVQRMEDTIKLLQKQIGAISNEYSTTEDILNRTTRLIESSVTSGKTEKEISSTELIKLVEYYTAKVQALKVSLYALQLKKNDIDEKVAAVQKRMTEITSTTVGTGSKILGQIVLQVMTKAATTADFNISYFTRNAGWIPAYDLRIKTLDNTFKLAYKAAVSQTTGIDWKDVKLSLSTSNPNQGSTVPIISPWYVQMYVPELYNQMIRGRANDSRAYNRMQSMGSAAQISKSEMSADAFKLEEKELVGEPSDVSIYTSLSESQLYTSFDIDLPYDIPGDGKAYNVSIKEENIKATYKHYAVPKFDKDAFLVAEISDWENLNLLPGEATIIMDNVYLGKSFIDPNTTMDTLNLSLGRDKRIAVKRILVKESSKSKIKGDTKTETFTYEITVKNNKKQAISMLLKDQYPLSNVKEVEVTLDDNGGSEVNAELGTLNWKLNLDANQSKTYRFTYSIKYPKDKKIMNIR